MNRVSASVRSLRPISIGWALLALAAAPICATFAAGSPSEGVLPYAGVVDSPSVIASCSLLYDSKAHNYEPAILLQPGAGSPQDVRFSFFDASGAQVGTQVVRVAGVSSMPLPPFAFDGTFAVVHCGLRPVGGSSGGGGGGGAGILIGVLAAGAIAAVAAGHGGGANIGPSGGVTARPSPTNVASATPSAPATTPTPTPTMTASPAPRPTPTPTPTPSPIGLPSLLPGPTPTPTLQIPTPTPTPTFILLIAKPQTARPPHH